MTAETNAPEPSVDGELGRRSRSPWLWAALSVPVLMAVGFFAFLELGADWGRANERESAKGAQRGLAAIPRASFVAARGALTPARGEAAKTAPGGWSIHPVVTDEGTSFAVASTDTWAEIDAARLMEEMDGENPPNGARQHIDGAWPGIDAALASADFDLRHDLLSVGVMRCGAGWCFSAGVALRDPGQFDRIVKAVFGLLAGRAKEIEPGHFGGPAGSLGVLHVHFFPIDWSGLAPDAGGAMRRATHVVFVVPDAIGVEPIEPQTLFAAPSDARPRLVAIEALTDEHRGRWAIGEVAEAKDFGLGFDLKKAAFVAFAPTSVPHRAAGSGGDALDFELSLRPSKPATAHDVEGWIARAFSFADSAAARVSVPAPLVRFVHTAVEVGLSTRIQGSDVVLSWKSSQVTAEEANRLEQARKGLAAVGPRSR